MTADADAHVIDDDEAVRESIEFLLRSAQLTVKTYESASAFLAVAPTINVDRSTESQAFVMPPSLCRPPVE